MNIYLFDFDNTIVELPYEETINYLDKKESLSKKLNFKLIEETRKDYLRVKSDTDGKLIILSNRRSEVGPYMVEILKHFDYKFEDYFLIEDGNRCKGDRVNQILEKYPDCSSVTYWEDKDKHIYSVTETMKSYPDINFVVVKTI